MPTLTFLGAAGTVTGSKHLLDLDGRLVLVDCGLFQGLKELRERNWAALPVDPRRIDAVVLTHAHLDHCGYLPRLVGGGFRGRIFCTPGTKDLCTLILPDSAHIQEEDARQANRHGYSKHQPALPLYTELDAARTLTQLQPVGYDRPVPVVPGVEVEFINAGHLLGSAYARFRIGDKTLLFGGDLGTVRPSRAAGSDAGRDGRRVVARVDLRQPAASARRWRREAGGDHQRDGEARRQDHHPVVRRRSRRRAAVLAATVGADQPDPERCRSSSTARWRPARCSSTPSA